MKTNFALCCTAITSVLDFVQKECWCASTAIIGGANTLVPFVYYLFHLRKQEVRNDQIVAVRKALYLFGFAKPFSRYSDSRLWKFIKEELRPLAVKKDERFPFDKAVWWVNYWEDIDQFGEKLLQKNPILALHVIQNLSGAKSLLARNSGEMDHIFPRSRLRSKNFDEAQINHFANFWILGKGKNQNKSNRAPSQYFQDVPEEELNRALIQRDLLDYSQFSTFLTLRKNKMIEHVKQRLQFTDLDFQNVSLPEKLLALGWTPQKIAALIERSSKKKAEEIIETSQ